MMFYSKIKTTFAGLLISSALIMSCSQNKSIEPSQEDATSSNDKSSCVYVTNDACGTTTNKSNCVLFARCKRPTLPFGLTSYTDKVKKINSYVAGANKTAVINTGSRWGHVAHVLSVTGSGTTAQITLLESNWCGANISKRTGTATSLKIVGYIQ